MPVQVRPQVPFSWVVSSVGRVGDSKSLGHRFESGTAHHFLLTLLRYPRIINITTSEDNHMAIQITLTDDFLLLFLEQSISNQWFNFKERRSFDHSILTPAVVDLIAKEIVTIPPRSHEEIFDDFAKIISDDWVLACDTLDSQLMFEVAEHNWIPLQQALDEYKFDYTQHKFVPTTDLFNGILTSIALFTEVLLQHKDKKVRVVFRNETFGIEGAFDFFVFDTLTQDESAVGVEFINNYNIAYYLHMHMQVVELAS